MFHTFNLTAPARHGPDPRAPSSALPSRQRQKVSRACDRCRTFRIKCGEKPCPRCVLDKVRCTWTSGPAAKQKSNILVSTGEHHPEPRPKNRVRPDASPEKPEISLALATVSRPPKRSAPAGNATEMIIPSYGRVKLDEHMDPLNRPAYVFAEIDAFFADSRTTSRTSTKGVMADLQTAYPGPFPDLPQIAASADSQPACNEHLTDEQQTYFLRLFWEAYHPLLQATNEAEFQSLLALHRRRDSEAGQLANALVNCMTALGIQYGHVAGLASRILTLRRCAVNISWIGYGYFRRCRDYIALLTEPTLLSMQCYALMSLYLMNASQFRDAYSLLGTAIRDSHSVNLHEEPSERLQPKDRIAQRRIWWLLFMLDIKCSQQLGKPVAVQTATITCALPSVDELTTMPENTRVCWKDLHVSTYFVHAVKFAVSLAEIQRLISPSKLFEDTNNITALEQRPNLLATSLAGLEKWSNELPEDLISPRKNTGHAEAMSTAESPIVLELGAPSWLHHQRVLLEVYYHNAYVMLQRPFISNPSSSRSRRAIQWIFKALAVFEAFAATEPFAARAETLTKSLVTKLNDILTTLDEKSEQEQTNDRGRIAPGLTLQQSPDS
ncbi:transcription factor fungal specific, partial [Aspergillus fumigatus]